MRLAVVSCEALPDWEIDDAPLLQALAEAGHAVARPAWSDPDVDWASFDGALLRTPWDYASQVDRFVAWAERAAAVTPLWHGPAVLRWNLRKGYLVELEARGVPIAPTVWLPAGARVDVAEACRVRGWERGFLKPVVGASARETFRFDVEAPAGAQAHADRLLPSEGLMLQPYLPSVEREGELSVIFIDGAPTHAVRKVPVTGDYRVQDDYGAHDEPTALTDELMALAAQAVAAGEQAVGVGFLYARVDCLRLPKGRLVLNELEVVEPSLFFRHGRGAAARLAAAFVARLDGR